MSNFKRITASIAPIAFAMVLGGVANLPAVTAAQAKSNVNPAIADICRLTMQTFPGSNVYYACIETLSDTANDTAKAADTEQARQTCATEGLTERSSALALCIVNHRNPKTATPPPIDSSIIQTSAKAYWRMSNKEEHRAEEDSCATLGLQPDSRGFRACVDALDRALLEANFPPG